MNKRIKELSLDAANEIADLFTPGFFDDRMVNDVAQINEKLAKSIVNECASIVQEYMSRFPEDHVLTRRVKERFGI